MKILAKTEEFSEGKFLVVRRDGSIPHWPHFVLGARDPAAPGVMPRNGKPATKGHTKAKRTTEPRKSI